LIATRTVFLRRVFIKMPALRTQNSKNISLSLEKNKKFTGKVLMQKNSLCCMKKIITVLLTTRK